MIRHLFRAATVLVFAAHAAAAEPRIFLVRHAEKAEATSADPKNPELSAAGRVRAEALATMLKDARITAVYATEFKRTQQTGEPLARAADIQVTILPANDTAGLVAKLQAADGNALVVGHSNTLPQIITALGVTTPPAINDTDYDYLFVWTANAPTELLQLHYR